MKNLAAPAVPGNPNGSGRDWVAEFRAGREEFRQQAWVHLWFLPGFYLASAATFLHFLGLVLIPSAKPLQQTGVPADRLPE